MKLLMAYIFLLSAVSFGQIDSILNKIESEPGTTKIRILNKLCWDNRSNNPQFALQCGTEALNIASKIENKSLQAISLNYIGVIYRNLGDYNTSLHFYFRALKLADQANDSIQIAYSYNNIGGIYRLTGDYQSALYNIFKALNIFEKLNDRRGIAFCTINIAIIYRKENNFVKSIEYLNHTLKIREELRDEQGIALTMNHLAEVYYEQQDFDKALEYYLILQNLYEKINEKKGLAAVWGGIGGVYQNKGDYANAVLYRQKALDLNREIGNVDGEIINLNNLAIVQTHFNKNQAALDLLMAALQLSTQIGSDNSRLDCYKYFTKYYEIISNYPKAFEYSQKFIQLKDSILSKEQMELAVELEARYKIEKAQKDNELLQKDIESGKKQRTYLIIIVALIVIVVIVTYWRYTSKKNDNKKLQKLNTMKDRFFKILAHDLKNPFHSLLSFSEYLNKSYDSLEDDEIKTGIAEMNSASKNLYELVENLLDWSKAQTGSIEFNPKEIFLKDLIQKNISIFAQNAKLKKINLTMDVGDDHDHVVFGDEYMINTIVRNLLSNAIKFSNHNAQVSVNSEKRDGEILIHFKDSGVGIEKEKLHSLFSVDRSSRTLGTSNERGSGLGLMLVKELVQINHGKVSVESELGKGSTFTISLPSTNN